MSPGREWRLIDQEDISLWNLCFQWLLPLMLLAVVALLFGQHIYNGISFLPYPALFKKFLLLLVWGGLVLFVQLSVAALVTQLCIPFFGGRRHLRKACALIAYAAAGLLVAAVMQPLLVPLFPLVLVLGSSWSVYLLLSGMPVLMQVSIGKARVISGITVVLFLMTNTLLMPLADRVWEGSSSEGSAVALPELSGAAALRSGEGQELGTLEKIRQADRNLDEAAREAGNASARNDQLAAAQAARDAAVAIAATVSGGQARVPLTAQQLRTWFPTRLLGLERQSLQIEPWGSASSNAITAYGVYGHQGTAELGLRLVDPASAGALLAESAATGAQGRKDGETAMTIERSYREGARSVSELRWKNSRRIEIDYILANGVRLMVNADDIDASALHQAIRGLPLDVLERDRMVPVERVSGSTGTTPQHSVQSAPSPP